MKKSPKYLIAVLILATSLSGCAGNEPSETADAVASSAQAQETEATTTEAVTTKPETTEAVATTEPSTEAATTEAETTEVTTTEPAETTTKAQETTTEAKTTTKAVEKETTAAETTTEATTTEAPKEAETTTEAATTTAVEETTTKAPAGITGTFTETGSSYDDYGWKPSLSITFEDGTITKVYYDEVNASGNKKSQDTDYLSYFKEKTGVALDEVYKTLSGSLLSNQAIEKVDAVSGATVASDNFIKLAKKIITDNQ